MLTDYIVVGAGLTGCVVARELANKGNKVLIFEKENIFGGNIADIVENDIPIALHGGHFFHTNHKRVWEYVNEYSEFIPYYHRVKAFDGQKIYSFPINLLTFSNMFYRAFTKEKAKKFIEELAWATNVTNPKNFEEKMLSLVGETIYYTFFYGYTKKHWGKDPKELPMNLVNRIPIRFDYNDQYSTDLYQGMPVNGYTEFISELLNHRYIEIVFNHSMNIKNLELPKRKVIYTGPIDEYYDYQLGKLEYRGVEHKRVVEDLGCATINYTGIEVPFTRKICFNYFYPDRQSDTFYTFEEYSNNKTKDYPIETKHNLDLYHEYKNIPSKKVIFTGRLGSYKYIDMDQAILMAWKVVEGLE